MYKSMAFYSIYIFVMIMTEAHLPQVFLMTWGSYGTSSSATVTHCDCYQVIWNYCHEKLLCVWSSNVCWTCMCFQFHYRGSSHQNTHGQLPQPLEVEQSCPSVPHRGSKHWNRYHCGKDLGRCSSSSASCGGEWTGGQAFYPHEKRGSFSYPVLLGLESHDSMKTVITRIWTIACHDFMWKCVF